MKSYKSKTKIKSKTRPLTIKKKSKNRVNMHGSIKRSRNRSKNWDVLIHASNLNINILTSISNDNMLKVPDKQLTPWLNNLHTKSNFGNYFNYKNNRYNIIKLLTENIDNINVLKYEKESSGKFKMIKENKLENNEINWLYTPAVYTHYLFNNCNYNEYCWAWGCGVPDILFVISSKILRDKPFICCQNTMYGKCINIGDTFYNFKKGFYGKGNLKRKPSMKQLQEYINKKVKKNEINYNYSLTHEIMFDNIPLKYVNAIFYYDEYISVDKLKSLFPNIKLVSYPLIDEIKPDGTILKIPDFSIIFNYKKLLEPYSY